jgi:prepilin peptidase CpaA
MSTIVTLDLFLIALVLAAGMHDLIERKIPNRLVLCGLFCAAALQLASPTPSMILTTGLAGMAAGFLLFFPLYCVRGMAAGDVKLMAMAGSFSGPALALDIALATFLIGGLMSVAWVVALGRSGEALANLRVLLRPVYMRLCGVPYVKENLPRRSVGGIPYGAALALGACGVVLWRHG